MRQDTSAFVVTDHPYGREIRFTVSQLDFVMILAIGSRLVRFAQENGTGRLRLDLGHVEFLSGAALGVFAAMHAHIARSGGELLLHNVRDFPYEQFQVTRLDTVLNVWPARSAEILLASL